ncbi:MAG: hypothetical protein ACTSRW_02260 [Candidatus Helarchaeota archaeon]
MLELRQIFNKVLRESQTIWRSSQYPTDDGFSLKMYQRHFGAFTTPSGKKVS